MVKILKCYNFRSSSIVPMEREPKVFAGGKDKLFIGTTGASIEVFSIHTDAISGDKLFTKYCRIQTGDDVNHILYNTRSKLC
ncbi:hypothetical protein ACJMK2_020285 [Sinanodonta woodiana]|uniref:BLOC-2 complex member HPS3 N-terminal domain-containing protein n=1 Tax=Sinanodonta woodiana TaxID=1069815 RepID=A0ABD3U0C0_SINWO